MFNPTDFDEVCVQANHIESCGRPFNFSKKAFKQSKIKDPKDNKGKSSLKGKKIVTTQKEGERPSCAHTQMIGHDEERCWELHIELKPDRKSVV